jgi:hypothetical protein
VVEVDDPHANPWRAHHQASLKSTQSFAQGPAADAQLPREFGFGKLLPRLELA